MDHSDWDSVLQFVADPVEFDLAEKHTAERTDRVVLPHQTALSQVPTPPQSHDGSPVVDSEDSLDGNTLVSVSTTFYPGAQNNSLAPDIALLSSDSVFFYVHSHVLLGASENGFQSMIPVPASKHKDYGPVLPIQESSAVLNVILHAVYDMSCAHYSPSFETLLTAVNCLPAYGIHPKSRIALSTPLFALLLSHAPLHPLELYALAAAFDLYDLAVSTSSHLLSYPLSTISDDTAVRIGPVYLKRLFFLHFGRSDALKRVLLPPPHPHAPTPWCDFTEQKKLTRAWALASAYLAWDARPDLSTSTMENALSPLGEHLSCDLCRTALKERIKNLIVQWSVVKRTI